VTSLAKKRGEVILLADQDRGRRDRLHISAALPARRPAWPLLDALAADPSLAAYPYLFSARGDLLGRLGRVDEARVDFVRAATMTRNARDRGARLARAGSPAGARRDHE
jgi:predicted RNA polymerase sigma factor